ncbi:MAG TPA: hypothetical protein VIY09_04270 [Rhizomicrobium sp.]
MEWSHGLLPHAERIVLRRLAAFAVAFSIAAAELVVEDWTSPGPMFSDPSPG